MYCLGVDLGEPATSWARAVTGPTAAGGTSIEAEGVVPSAVGVGADGALAVAPAATSVSPSPTGVVSGFVGLLGSSEPVMVGGTPYGVEALVACVLAEVLAVGASGAGSQPDLVMLVRDDDLDPYRVSTLHEAARIAGIAPDRLLLVARSDAAAAGGSGTAIAATAARLGWQSLPDAAAGPNEANGDLAAGAGGLIAGGAAGVAGAIGLGGALSDGGVASAAGTAAGPVSGPGGSALGTGGSSSGPVGSTVGPGGTSVGPGGTSVGPGGASAVAGPSGSGPVGVGVSGSGTIGTASSAFPWIPVAIGAAIAVVMVVGAIVVLGGDEDPPPDEAAVVVTTDAIVTDATSAIEPASSTVPVETDVVTTAAETTVEPESSTTLNPDIDLSAFVGDWVVCAPSPDAPNVSAAVEYSFTRAGPNQLTLDYVLLVYTDSGDCSTAGLPSNEDAYTVDVVGETVIDGVPAVQVDAFDGPFVMGVVGDTLRYGKNSPGEGFPTAFDPTLVYSRRS